MPIDAFPKTFEDLLEQVPETRKESALRYILARNNTCQVWIGGSENDRFTYPYRLVPVDRITDRMRKASTQLMIDSTIGDPHITNESVIEKAIEYDAQYVVPKDYWGEIEETHESIIEFLNIYDDTGCGATVIFPLQPPHQEHFEKYRDFYEGVSHIAVGGVKEESTEAQVKAIKKTRNIIGPHKHLHGLGMGASKHLIDTLNANPNLLDSFDTSTFEQLPGFGKVADSEWKQRQISLPQGNDIFTLNAVLTEFMVYMANYQLSSLSSSQTPSAPSDTAIDNDQATLSDSWTTTNQQQNQSVGSKDEVQQNTDNILQNTATIEED